MEQRKSFLEELGLKSLFSNTLKNIYKNETVLITGDSGFKGSWLSLWLHYLGAKVIGYSFEPRTSRDNFVICGLTEKITHITNDIRDYEALLEAFKKYKPSFVFHLAAQPIVLDSYNDPITNYSTNLMGTVNVFEASRYTDSVEVIVNITSDKCYENKEWIYGYRETDPMGGKDPYSASKGAAELITSSYIQSFFNNNNTASLASARAGNVIGGGDWSLFRLIPDCINALEKNETIIIRNPSSVRPWQHVLEPLSGYLLLAAKLKTEGKKYSSGWNFGPKQNNMINVETLVKDMIKQWGNGSYKIEKQKDAKPEAGLLHLDISKSLNLLGWSPALNFEQTIEHTIAEYKINSMSVEQVYNQRLEHIEYYSKIQSQI